MEKIKIVENKLLELKEFSLNNKVNKCGDINLQGTKSVHVSSIELFYAFPGLFNSRDEFESTLFRACRNIEMKCLPINSTGSSNPTKGYQGYGIILY